MAGSASSRSGSPRCTFVCPCGQTQRKDELQEVEGDSLVPPADHRTASFTNPIHSFEPCQQVQTHVREQANIHCDQNAEKRKKRSYTRASAVSAQHQVNLYTQLREDIERTAPKHRHSLEASTHQSGWKRVSSKSRCHNSTWRTPSRFFPNQKMTTPALINMLAALAANAAIRRMDAVLLLQGCASGSFTGMFTKGLAESQCKEFDWQPAGLRALLLVKCAQMRFFHTCSGAVRLESPCLLHYMCNKSMQQKLHTQLTVLNLHCATHSKSTSSDYMTL